MNKKHQSAGCIVYRKKQEKIEILIMHRIWPKGEEGWILPKGTLEKGETLEECALRETIEETGYNDLEIFKKLGTESYYVPKINSQKTVHWYLALAKSDSQQAPKYSKTESLSQINIYWKGVDEAIELLTFEENRNILKVAMNDGFFK